MLKPIARSLIKTIYLFIFLSRTVQSEDIRGSITKPSENAYLAKDSPLQQQECKIGKIQQSQQKRLDSLQQQAYYSAIGALSQSPTSLSLSSIQQPATLVEHPSSALTKINLPVEGVGPAAGAAKINLPNLENGTLWCAEAGKTLKEAIHKWKSIAGWSVQWDSDYDYPILAEVCFKGSFDQIMGDVIDAYRHAEHPFYLDLYPKQQLAVISN